MCFSATASFAATAVIGTVGVATWRTCRTNRQKWLASVPFLFALQQFCEGFVWLSLKYGQWQAVGPAATQGFLLFAWVIWPVMIPWSVLKLEHPGIRREIIGISMGLGIVSGIYALYLMIAAHPVAHIEGFHIDYTIDEAHRSHLISMVRQAAYLFATVLPLFVSSVREMFVLAAGNLLALLISFFFFRHAIPSTWCFFAAILSMIILRITTLYSRDHLNTPHQ